MLNRRAVVNVAGAAAVLFLSASLPVGAQGAGGAGAAGGQGRPGGAFGGQGGAFGGQMPPQFTEMITKMRQTRASVDPGISNGANLLTRSDVRNELFLNGRQTEAIAALQNGYPAAMMQQVMSSVMETFRKMREEGGGVDFRNMTADDRQQMFQQVSGNVQDAMITVQADQDKKAEALLNPTQIKRLHELDLQWRGPLALAEEKVGEKVSLTPEQRAKFAAMLKEFRAERQKLQMGMMGGMGGPGGPGGFPGRGGAGANGAPGTPKPADAGGASGTQGNGGANDAQTAPPQPGAPGQPGGRGFTIPTQEQMQQNLEKASKQTEVLLKAAEKKTLILLTPEQQAQWKTLQGKPFTFRQYL